MEVGQGEITLLLLKWREGEHEAFEQLMPLVYPHFRGSRGPTFEESGIPASCRLVPGARTVSAPPPSESDGPL